MRTANQWLDRIATAARVPDRIKREKQYNQIDEDLKQMKKRVATDQEWAAFARRYRAEMATPENRRTLDRLAALSHGTDFAVGCYCADETRCHRSLLRDLLAERGAKIE